MISHTDSSLPAAPAEAARMPIGARRLVLIGGLCIPVGLVAGPYLFGLQLVAVAGGPSRWLWPCPIGGGAGMVFPLVLAGSGSRCALGDRHGRVLAEHHGCRGRYLGAVQPTDGVVLCRFGSLGVMAVGTIAGWISRFLADRHAHAPGRRAVAHPPPLGRGSVPPRSPETGCPQISCGSLSSRALIPAPADDEEGSGDNRKDGRGNAYGYGSVAVVGFDLLRCRLGRRRRGAGGRFRGRGRRRRWCGGNGLGRILDGEGVVAFDGGAHRRKPCARGPCRRHWLLQ